MDHEDWDEVADALRARAPRERFVLPAGLERAARAMKVGEDAGPRESLAWLAEVARQAYDIGAEEQAQEALAAAETRVDAALARLADLRDALAEAREAMQDGEEEQLADALRVVGGCLAEVKAA